MDEDHWLAARFEEQRCRLRAVAYRLLGSLDEADDAVQDTWVRASRAGTDDVDNLAGWLTTITARICLNMLRTRRRRGEQPLDLRLPDPVVSPHGQLQPEDEALLADSVGLALLVVLESLSPAGRLAFVLHDMFQLPYAEIGAILGRSEAAARQLASRARRRVQGAPVPDPAPDLARQRELVDAYFAAARGGDFAALVRLLHPDVVLRADHGPQRPADSRMVRGATDVVDQVLAGANPAATLHPAVVSGTAGMLVTIDGQPHTLMGFTISDGRIVAIDVIADPRRVRRVAAAILP